MSPRRDDPFAADHERARELAALRLDEPLRDDDAAWLGDHLGWCAECTDAAADYEEQRVALRSLRFDSLDAPRDLWARTAAAIEDAGGRAPRRRARGWAMRTLPLAPVVAVLVVAVAVGAGLFNGSSLLTPGSTIKGGDGALATPIAMAAGDVQVLSPGDNGSLEILSRHVDKVCPVGAETCGLSNSLDVSQVSSLATTGGIDAIISPDKDHLVVVEHGTGAQGVYVVAVHENPSASPSGSPTPASASPSESPTPSASPTPSGSPTPSESPSTPASPIATPTPTAPPSDQPSPSVEPASPSDASLSPSPSVEPPSASPTPEPSVTVTPGPDGALQIAHDVIVVGSTAGYAPDGTAFAFTARPVDGSTGPDVYVWRVGETEAHAVTTDHGSLFAGWLDQQVLVSRVVDGTPVTIVLDLASGTEQTVQQRSMWRPTVGPGHRMAAWWDGSVKRADDTLTWVGDAGRLVLAPWPAGAADAQVLADGPITDWEVRWDESGTAMAVWIAGDTPAAAGRLSLYTVDPATGRANLDQPKLAATPAYAGFSLHDGRLVWSAPEEGGDTTVQVLAWSGDAVGRLTLPAENGAIVVR